MNRIQLTTLRLKADLKQYQLAQRLGIHPSIISNLERGRRPITPEIVERIRKAIHEAQAAKAKR